MSAQSLCKEAGYMLLKICLLVNSFISTKKCRGGTSEAEGAFASCPIPGVIGECMAPGRPP